MAPICSSTELNVVPVEHDCWACGVCIRCLGTGAMFGAADSFSGPEAPRGGRQSLSMYVVCYVIFYSALMLQSEHSGS